MKASARAPSNIAFIKYWGKKDEKLRLPLNSSISMNLSELNTTTTVEFNNNLKSDEIMIDGKSEKNEVGRVTEHLDRIRKLAGTTTWAKVVSKNSFPARSGLSSSASGFAALTLAATSAIGLKLSLKKLSILARLASGSACRSIPDGFVEWKRGTTHEDSYAYSLYPETYWDIADIVVIVSEKKKYLATTKAQQSALTSPFLKLRLSLTDDKILALKKHIQKRDFKKFGELVEEEALEMQAILNTSAPPLFYLLPETIRLFWEVWKMREEGIAVYFTVNTGHNVHIICHSENISKVIKKLDKLPEIKKIIVNNPSHGARLLADHLF